MVLQALADGLDGLMHACMQDSERLEALLTWMEEEPVQGSIFFVVRSFTAQHLHSSPVRQGLCASIFST